MLDIVERMESVAERQYDEMLQPNGKLKCFCGRLFNPNEEGGTISPNPYAMPMCSECFEEAYTQFSKGEC